jgi:hypothetical protein
MQPELAHVPLPKWTTTYLMIHIIYQQQVARGGAVEELKLKIKLIQQKRRKNSYQHNRVEQVRWDRSGLSLKVVHKR